MEEQLSLGFYPWDEEDRWTILLEKKEADDFNHPDFEVLNKHDNYFNEDYSILEVKTCTGYNEDTAEDILIETGALAVHAEYTNGIITTPDALEVLNDKIYHWSGAGAVFLGDMLTDIEKAHFLMKYLYNEYKEPVTINDIKLKKSKNGEEVDLIQNIDALFNEDLYSAIFKEHEVVLWWHHIIKEMGLFLVVLEDKDDDDDNDDEPSVLEDQHYCRRYAWGAYYDDYDYYDDDRFYHRT